MIGIYCRRVVPKNCDMFIWISNNISNINYTNHNTILSNYSIDLAIINGEVYFIELNCFGKEYAAGSALFHWLLDEHILYGKMGPDYVDFRYNKR
jgi:hypothetical protein